MAEGDLHSTAYDKQKKTIDFAENYYDPDLTSQVDGHCQIFLDVYPTKAFEEEYDSSLPIVFTMIIASLFAIMAVIFIVYDSSVQNHNNKVLGMAARSNAIVSSAFPSNVCDRLLAEDSEHNVKKKNGGATREPSHVFILLETVHYAFDEIARRRRVFKVAIIGDCYVAVCGLPVPQNDHAVTMARFARDCMHQIFALTKKLETTLGPDTGDLSMRMGFHSDPITRGVLRGEASERKLREELRPV
jgi:hypothetical protein